jgi:hypothetical protein
MQMDICASNWNEADAANSSAAPDGWPEGMAPSGVNDSGRAMMGALKRWYNWTVPKISGGTSTAYTLTYDVAPAALVDGMSHMVQFHAANGASPTLNVNGLGAIPIYAFDGGWAPVPNGAIKASATCNLAYNMAEGSYRIISWPTLPARAANFVQNFLTMNVNLANIDTFYNGPNTGTIGAAGQTWLIMAVANVADSTTTASIEAAIYDGTSYIAGSSLITPAANGPAVITVNAIVSLSGPKIFTLRVKDSSQPTGVLLTTANVSAVTNKATSITAIRLS